METGFHFGFAKTPESVPGPGVQPFVLLIRIVARLFCPYNDTSVIQAKKLHK
jgi:hypothetical protein